MDEGKTCTRKEVHKEIERNPIFGRGDKVDSCSALGSSVVREMALITFTVRLLLEVGLAKL